MKRLVSIFLKCLLIAVICMPISVLALGAEVVDPNCPGAGRASLNNFIEFGCDTELMANECKTWFEQNPETMPFAKNCKRNESSSSDSLASTCAKAGIESWSEILDMLSESVTAIETCDNNIECKKKLAKDAYFVCNNPDGTPQYPCVDETKLANVYAGDLFRKKAMVQSLAWRDRAYRAELEKEGVPLPTGNERGMEISSGLLWELAKAKMKELGVKYSCYNSQGYSHMACYAIASVVDPTFLIPGGAVVKGGKWAAAVLKDTRRASKTAKELEAAAKEAARLAAITSKNALLKEAEENLYDATTSYHSALRKYNAAIKDQKSNAPELKKILDEKADRHKEAVDARLKLVSAEGKPSLTALEKNLGDTKSYHRITSNDQGPVLKIAYVKRDEKKFMGLALKAIREGELTQIDAGIITGPKVFMAINTLAKDTAKSGKKLTIWGNFDQDTHAVGKALADGGVRNADEWSQSEVEAFHQAVKDLGLNQCTVYECDFVITIENGKISAKIAPKP